MKLIVVAVALFAPLAVSATTLIDGSFEAKGTATAVDYCYDSFSAGGRPPCAASPWTGAGVIQTGAGAWGGTTTPDGSYYAFVQQNQSLSQTFTATASETLSASWIDSNRSGTGGPHSYTVSIDPVGPTPTIQPLGAFSMARDIVLINRKGFAPSVTVGTYTSSVGPFVQRTSAGFDVVAGTTYTLSFTGIFDGTDSTSFIDSVALVSAVPEPATWGLMIAGFGLVGFAARRRRTAVAA